MENLHSPAAEKKKCFSFKLAVNSTETHTAAHTLAGREVQVPASSQARRHPLTLTTSDSLGTGCAVHEEIPCWQLQSAGFCPAALLHAHRTRAPLLQGYPELAADVHPANSERRKTVKNERMAHLLHWLLLFSCRPSQTLQHGFKHAPCAFLTGSDTLFCPCFPSPGWQAGTWQLSASSTRSALVPRGSDWAPCLSSLLHHEPSSLFSSTHCLWANDGSSPHIQAISLKPALLPMHPAGILKKLQSQH